MHDEEFMKEFRGLIKGALSYKYFKTPSVSYTFDLDDLVQDVVLRFLSPMKNGQERLSYYLEHCETKKHFENVVKQASYRAVLQALRHKQVKHKALFLDELLNVEYSNTSHQDLIIDTNVNIENQVAFKRLVQTLPTNRHRDAFRRLLEGERRLTLRKSYPDLNELLEAIQKHILENFPELKHYLVKVK